MDFLKDHDFHLLVSLDGDKENTGYRVDKAGNCAFARVVRNVDALRKKYPDYFKERVNFNAVLHNKIGFLCFRLKNTVLQQAKNEQKTRKRYLKNYSLDIFRENMLKIYINF